MAQQAPAQLTESEERTWAMIAHLSILLNLISGILGSVAALVIYLVVKERSRYAAYQSLQAVLFQLIFWIGGGILTGIAWTLTGTLATILIGFLCLPIALIVTLVPVAALVYSIYAGIKCSQGADFRYWLVGDWVRSTLTGK